MQHVAEHNISYGTIEEFNFRHNLFVEVDNLINESNANPENTFELGHNFLSTWTQGERKRLLGYNGLGERDEVVLEETNGSGVDWRDHNAVNAVQDQASCGSCWSFSATAAVEAAHAIKTNSLVKLSEEQLVQCSTRNNGCGGGSMALAFKYLEGPGQNTESAYPYTSGRGVTGKCNKSLEGGKVKTTGYKNVQARSSSQLMAAIDKTVVSVAIEADKSVFQQYKTGILNSAACGTNLDHGVAAVGYGSDGGQQYYIVRNSWGPRWGDKGYLKIAVASGNGICGIQMDPVYPSTN